MANSRTERIGTIFSRVTSLLKGGAIQEENLPLWYNVYKAFPPKYEPAFGRPVPQKQIKKIFYKEDHLRAKFHKDVTLPILNLRSDKVTQTQIFFTIYESLLQAGVKEEEVYNKTLESYKGLYGISKPSNTAAPSTPSQTIKE